MSFNRTNVELKHFFIINYLEVGMKGFNRTNVELKHMKNLYRDLCYSVLIEPMWN